MGIKESIGEIEERVQKLEDAPKVSNVHIFAGAVATIKPEKGTVINLQSEKRLGEFEERLVGIALAINSHDTRLQKIEQTPRAEIHLVPGANVTVDNAQGQFTIRQHDDFIEKMNIDVDGLKKRNKERDEWETAVGGDLDDQLKRLTDLEDSVSKSLDSIDKSTKSMDERERNRPPLRLDHDYLKGLLSAWGYKPRPIEQHFSWGTFTPDPREIVTLHRNWTGADWQCCASAGICIVNEHRTAYVS